MAGAAIGDGWVVVSLFVALLCGLLQIGLYADADQLDSGYHYLFARWSWHHAEYLLSVWARPLFTLLYSAPAQLGYTAARAFTLLISLLTGYQTWRLARQLGLSRPYLAIPLLMAQPVFWQLSTGVFTESLFALLLATALRLRLGGHPVAAILTTSSLILVRPEGLFVGLFWGVWELAAGFRGLDWKGLTVKAASTMLLGTGMLIWVVASWLLTGDWLWIVHNWPPDWNPNSQANGTGPIWWYVLMLPMICGPFTLPAFLSGLREHWRQAQLNHGLGLFLTIFVVHSVLYNRGWFGAAGYARYFVCISPVTALICLAGWPEQLAGTFARGHRWLWSGLLAASLLFSFTHVDLLPNGRDTRAIADLYLEFNRTAETRHLPIGLLICSQPAMRIVFNRDHWEMPGLASDRSTNLELLRKLPPGTLIFWDSLTGPAWYRLAALDFEEAGFERLISRDYLLTGRLLPISKVGLLGARTQTLHLFYRRAPRPSAQHLGKNY